MTVEELIEKLKQFNPKCKVWLEGCDCIDRAGGVELMEAPSSILITTVTNTSGY